MKLAPITVAASLVLSATAAVPFYHRRGLAPETTTLITLHELQTLPAEVAHVNVPGINYKVHIRTGGPMQHLGTLRKFRLYWAVYNALKNIAEPRSGKSMLCNDKKWPDATCRESENLYNIVYNAEPHDTYANNAKLKVTARWSEIYEDEHPGLRHEVYALIANIYRLRADDPSNCYEVNFPDSRRTTMCNVAQHVLVVFPVTVNNPVAVHVNVMVEFNGASTEGEFKCETSLTPIAELYRDKTHSNIAMVMKYDNAEFTLYLSCQKESCFDVDDGNYVERQPWREPRDCNPLGDT